MPWCSWVTDPANPDFASISLLPRFLGHPQAKARIRQNPEDFIVEEQLPFLPEGEGEHLFLHIRKCNTNTEWLARQLSRVAGIPARDVSYAGLKDRNAVTSQWFSLRIPGNDDPDLTSIESEDVQILQGVRHRKKLRRGALSANTFTLVLREIEGDHDELEQRLRQVAEHGVPNYFGEQRFGHDEGNLSMAQRLFAGELKKLSRNKRSIYLSAARSYLFNQVLAQRVSDSSWNRILAGEQAILDGTGSRFLVEKPDAELEQRAVAMDIHPSGPLWGRGRTEVMAQVHDLEGGVLGPLQEWCLGLEKYGLDQDRRPLRMRVMDLEWEWPDEQTLKLEFSLYPGSYATSLVRELVEYS